MAASETVGDRVRRYRRLRKLTQDELAEASDVDRRQIGRLEAGEVLEPSVETIRRLAAALKVPKRALGEPLGWWDDEKANKEDWLTMLMADERLDDDGKRSIERLVRLELEAMERAEKPPVPDRKRRAS